MLPRRSHLKSTLLVLGVVTSAFAALSCGGGLIDSPTLPDDPVVSAGASTDLTAEASATVSASSASKVNVCHRTGNGTYALINIAMSAYPAHMGHGDKPESFCTAPPATCPCFAAQDVESYPWGAACPAGGTASYVCSTSEISKYCMFGNNQALQRLYLAVDSVNGQCLAVDGDIGLIAFQDGLSEAQVAACQNAIQSSTFYQSGCNP